MPKNIIPFYATDSDLEGLIEEILKNRPLKFILAGMFDEPSIQYVDDLKSFECNSNYLVTDHSVPVEFETIAQRKGGEKFALDQALNQKTIVLKPGGLINNECFMLMLCK